MRLPQEICDLIIDHLYDDKSSLRCCSLVSRGWVYRSQAHLFYPLILWGRLWQRWFDTFPLSNQRIRPSVRNLILCLPTHPFVNFVRLQEYPAFKNLAYLNIDGTGSSLYKSQQFPYTRCFGHLRNTLKTLALDYVALHPCIIVGFPRLERLLVRGCRMPSVGNSNENEDIPESNSRRAFRGSLVLEIYSWQSEAGLLTTFANYPLEYDTITISVKAIDGEAFRAQVINRLISRCSSTLKVLDIRLINERTRKSGPAQPQSHPLHTLPMIGLDLDLSSFTHLCEISLTLIINRDLRNHLPRFSTITSGTMSKITITANLATYAGSLYNLFGGGYDWTDIDDDLLRLAEFQRGNNACRIDLVINILRVYMGRFRPSGRERKSFKKDWWVQKASEYAFRKFSHVGTIDFVLPPPVG